MLVYLTRLYGVSRRIRPSPHYTLITLFKIVDAYRADFRVGAYFFAEKVGISPISIALKNIQ